MSCGSITPIFVNLTIPSEPTPPATIRDWWNFVDDREILWGGSDTEGL